MARKPRTGTLSPPTTPEPKVSLDLKDLGAMEQQAPSLRDRALIRLLHRTGGCISEILGLAVDDVAFASGTICIQHLKVRTMRICPECKTRLAKNHSCRSSAIMGHKRGH